MTTQLDQNHDAPAGAPALYVGRQLPRLSPADAARTIVADGGVGTLATLATDPPGHPFSSVVSFAVTEGGDPLFFISELAEHTRNLRVDGRSSLLASEPTPTGVDPLALGRVTLLGTARPIPDDERAAAREIVAARHPRVVGYADYGDFACWRLAVEAVRWVGGFGRMTWIGAADYAGATADPVSAARHGVADHMNSDHADAGVLLCQRALIDGGHVDAVVVDATFDSVDRHGCDYVATTSAGPAFVRLAFDEPAMSLDSVRAAVVTLVRRARQP